MLKPGSVLLLVGHSEALLQQVKVELQGAGEEQRLVAHCIAADLSTADGLNQTVEVARQKAVKDTDHVLLINNAGES